MNKFLSFYFIFSFLIFSTLAEARTLLDGDGDFLTLEQDDTQIIEDADWVVLEADYVQGLCDNSVDCRERMIRLSQRYNFAIWSGKGEGTLQRAVNCFQGKFAIQSFSSTDLERSVEDGLIEYLRGFERKIYVIHFNKEADQLFEDDFQSWASRLEQDGANGFWMNLSSWWGSMCSLDLLGPEADVL